MRTDPHSGSGSDAQSEQPIPSSALTYRVMRAAEPVTIDADWTKAVWQGTPALDIANHMGDPPSFRPRVRVKLQYDDDALYVIFCVEDRCVRAVTIETHGNVCRDSCVEFFFSCGDDADMPDAYFNLETNCGCAMLFHHQTAPQQDVTPIDLEHCRRIDIRSSLPRTIDPEIADDVTWTLEYRLPLEILTHYCAITQPQPGAVWRANFYKCASDTSNPHYLTWNSVASPRPNFHLPQYFGTLIFC